MSGNMKKNCNLKNTPFDFMGGTNPSDKKKGEKA